MQNRSACCKNRYSAIFTHCVRFHTPVSTRNKSAGSLGIKKFAIAGGVASNSALREAMIKACEERGIIFYRPSPIFCTDNAAMIWAAAYYEFLAGTRSGLELNAVPNLKLGER